MISPGSSDSGEVAALEALAARRFARFDEALEDIARTAASVLNVGRVSIWLLARDQRCLNRVHAFPAPAPDAQKFGLTLDISLRPEYLRSLSRKRAFCLTEAAELSPRSSDDFAQYLKAFEVAAMLDAAIFSEGRLVGVLCLEDTRARQWASIEHERAIALARIAGRAIVDSRTAEACAFGERFRRLVDRSADAIGMATPQGVFEYLNPAARDILGLAPDEPIHDLRMADFLQPRGRDRMIETIFARARETDRWSGRLKMLTRQEERFEATVSIDVHRSADGQADYVSCAIRDLAQRMEVERRVNEVRARYESAFAHAGDSLLLVEPVTGRMLEVDSGFRTLLGYTEGQQALLTLQDLSEDSSDEVAARLERTQREGHLLCGERRLMHARGRWVHVEMSMIRADWHGEPAVSVRLRDISELVERRKDIERLAYYDPLTGLANSNLLRERADVMLAESLAGDRAVYFMLLQIDRWERIFDIQGYQVAESLIRQVGARLTRTFKRHDVLLARVLGGVEMGLLFDARHEDLDQIVDMTHAAFETSFRADRARIHLRVRSGSAHAPLDAVNFKDLSKRAGLALRNAHLRNQRHCVYDPTQSSRIQDEHMLEEDLRRAIHSDQLSLRYQPIRAVARDGAWSAVEVLVRWHHPKLGEVAPTDFIPLAEDSELIVALDRRALHEACIAAAHWRGRLGPVRVSINISAVTLMHPRVVNIVRDALTEARLDASRLCLEVTETSVMRDRTHAASVLNQLHELGVFIALDDFGTGYSSLAYLKDLPVDVLKIDRDFVRGIGTDSRDERAIQAIIQLGHDLGIRVVAEGVESREQYKWLASRDIDFVQGFHVGVPMTLGELRSRPRDTKI